MITLPNGHKLDFVVASGALGFDGEGYWFEKPFYWLSFIRPKEFTIITKTLTFNPRKGNLDWWKPWKSVRFIKNGVVNSVGLTNKGLEHWIKEYYPKLRYKTIISICPFSVGEARLMALHLDKLNLVGIETNLSCPNTDEANSPIEIVNAVVESTRHPVIVKLGYTNYLDFVRNYEKQNLKKKIAAYDLINSVPWKVVFPNKTSPLRPCSGVSGMAIWDFAREALIRTKILTKIPVIAGGAIDCVEEVYARLVAGAGAISFGTIFLQSIIEKRPWFPNEIVDYCRKEMYDSNSKSSK